MNTNVLIYPCGTEIAFEIFNSLCNEKNITLYGATSVPCHANFLFKRLYENAPFSNDPSLIDYLNNIVLSQAIDYIYPAHDDALLFLSENRNKLKCKIVASPNETIFITRSKISTYTKLYNSNYLPTFSTVATDFKDFPFFAKPAIGQGSFGVQKINSPLDLFKLDSSIEYIFCEYLPGEEFTIDCFTDSNGKLCFCNCRNRERIRAGISVRSRIVPLSDDINKIAEDINSKFSFLGAWFFQIKLDKYGSPKLMEIAPRIAGTMCVSRMIGVNLPLLTLYLFMNIKIKIRKNEYSVLLDRCFSSKFELGFSYDTVYVDFDDTLVLKDSINTQLIMFLYQCVNNKKRIVLLTKHSTDIFTDLEKFKISKELFSDVVLLKSNDKKSNFIYSKNSIFIDDSFAEREEVNLKTGINCFGTDMIEGLIDWRR